MNKYYFKTEIYIVKLDFGKIRTDDRWRFLNIMTFSHRKQKGLNSRLKKWVTTEIKESGGC